MEQTKTTHQIFLKVLAAVGLIVVLAGLAWGGVKALSYAPQALRAVASAVVGLQSRLFADEAIMLSTDQPSNVVVHGEEFTLSFEHQDKLKEGSYTFFYECRDGVHFEALPSVGREEVTFCNTYFNFVNEGDTLTLVPFSTKAQSIQVPIAIVFRENGSSEVDMVGSLTLTIFNNAITSTDTTKPNDGGTIIVDNNNGNTTGGGTITPGTETSVIEQFGTTTVPRFSDPNGRPDLAVTILETGTISRITDEFTATSTIRSNQRAAVKFEVQNTGTKKINGWRFNAVLPTSPRYIYSSQAQPELYPGDKIEFVIGFDSIIETETAGAKVTVNADPANSFSESNENNNIRSVILTVLEN